MACAVALAVPWLLSTAATLASTSPHSAFTKQCRATQALQTVGHSSARVIKTSKDLAALRKAKSGDVQNAALVCSPSPPGIAAQ